MAAVEEVNLTVVPKEFVAVMLDSKCLPTSSLFKIRVLAVAPAMVEHPAAIWLSGLPTELSHLNHW